MSSSKITNKVLFSVVIPNWNGCQHLQECLTALTRQTYKNFEVVFVDNASTDDSVIFVRQHFPQVKILEFQENIGFAGGVNAGIGVSHGLYVVLLNNDTAVESTWLENLEKAIRENPDISVFASKLVNYYNRKIIDSAGDGFDLFLGPYKIGESARSEIFDERRIVFGACGGGGCYKRELFERIGLFDEDFFAYFEDVDLSFRANWAGIRTLMVPDAIIYHKVGATSGANPSIRDRFDILRRRNYVYLIVKNYPFAFLVRYVPFIFVTHCLKFLLNLCRGRFRVAFMTQWEIVKGVPRMYLKRRAIMAERRISNSGMKSLCIPKYGGWWGFIKIKVKFGFSA
ncbi:MAG TPA: glycosyltransferase family 2 protein [Geobacteraceae bacterium]|nr:glycosyltransferase family 2 protein [Geobacteraceae bacterium]